MKDQIHIKDLECYGYHGVLKEEQSLGQPFLFDIVLWLDTSVASKVDDLTKTVNYAEVCRYIKKYMEEERCKLIETVAEQIAEGILLKFSMVEKIEVTIKKPQAPIPMKFDYVQVTICRSWHKVFLGIGANLGNKEENIKKAIGMFEKDPKCRKQKKSSLYPTKPYGVKEQDNFLNAAYYLETLYSPEEILGKIGTVEEELERVRTIHWGPRTIDIDILLYDEDMIHTENLCIPHAEMCKRDFVLIPLCEIAPYAFHPGRRKVISELLDELLENPNYEKNMM